jgi:putative ABC transport system permease protein
MRDWAAYVRAQLPALHVKPERESEIIAELAQQLEQAYEDAIAAGASEADAVAKARTYLGDWNRLAQGIEEGDGRDSPWIGALGDARYALRFLRRNPVFTAVAVATLAFGIGGNTAVFTLADRLLLHGLPYLAPESLIAVESHKAQQSDVEPWTSALDFFDFRDRTQSYSAVAAVSAMWNVVLTGRGPAEQLNALYVSAEFFPMLGVDAALGRRFAPEEDRRTTPSTVVMLSHSFWQRRFGGNRDVIGQSLALDAGTYTVIGILPAGFRWTGEPLAGTATPIDVWFPAASNPIVTTVRSVRYLKVAARLKPGITVQQASQEARSIGAALAQQFPGTNRGFEWNVRPLAELVTGRVRTTVLLLIGTVGFVLLMACANVANLLLARAAARQREIGVRVALGASRFRLLRQLLTEGLVLAAMGGCLGIPLAAGALRFLAAVGPDSLLQGQTMELDGRALAFTCAAVFLCALLAGLPPALRATADNIGSALRESGRGLVAGHHRLRAVLVAGQVAVALVLLVGAGLLIRSFRNLLEVRPGIDAHNLIAIATQLPSGARTPDQRKAIWERIRTQVEATPGVVGAAAVSRLPFAGRHLGSWVYIEGRSVPGEPGIEAEYRVCTPGYFGVMGIPLRAGRLFDAHDDAAAGAVVVISEAMARQFWPGQNAVGKRIRVGTNPENTPWITVIGVVGDVRHFGLEAAPRPELYRPYALNPLGAPILVVRTRVDAPALLSELSAKVRAVDPAIPTYNESVMERLVERSTAQRRFVMLLLAGFALAALLVAGVGIYGMVSQAVAQRTAEIGLRMALGATPADVLRMVFREGARLMGAGIAIGSAAAMGLAWLMRGMLFAMRPLDPAAFLAAAGTLALFALAACYVPARRATRVDPMTALRE